MAPRVVRHPAFKLFLLALVVRLLFVALFPGINYYDGITKEYFNVVNNFVHGRGLVSYVDIAPWNSGAVNFAYEPFVARPVGYVLFCSLVALVTGLSAVAIQIVQAIVTATSVFIVYALAKELFPDRSRLWWWSALLAALWPNEARFEIALLPDGMTVLIMLGLALELTRFLKTRAPRHALFAGLILAGSIYLRPDLVLFPVFFLAGTLFLLPAKESIRATAVMVLVLALSVGVNTWKNYAISGKIVPLNLGSGTTMYEGISQFGDTLGTTYADERLMHNKFNTKELFNPNGVENDRRVWREAIDTIEHHPGFYATLVVRRIPLLFTVRGLYFNDTASLADPNNDLAKRFPGKYIVMFREHPVQAGVRFLSPALGWLLVLAGFWGLILAYRASRTEHFMIALLLFYFISTHLLTNVEPRYFYPAVPLLYPYAIFAVDRRRPLGSVQLDAERREQ